MLQFGLFPMHLPFLLIAHDKGHYQAEKAIRETRPFKSGLEQSFYSTPVGPSPRGIQASFHRGLVCFDNVAQPSLRKYDAESRGS